ncbi:WG repeat-containing protein [Ruminococcus sp. Marseille-P6503]|uniref:WG repeat-containing protein n=1 Tax=Ruminococcus sp. Marseille-P6503 TaxID=2364796 RepID=UPI000F527638|nr:WG repeat-containing protein [Ruminococcus sp. Marseille-P6503]
MRKKIGAALSFAAACALLAGCSIPGLSDQSEDDEFIPDGSYYDNKESEENKVENYSWVLEPSVQADNIIVFDSSQIDPENESNTAYINASVIYKDGMYGFVDYKGNVIVKPSYSGYYTCACGEMVLYNVLDEKTGEMEYCTLDSQGQALGYVKDHEDYSPDYFWDSDEEEVYVLDGNKDYAERYTGKKTVVVAKAEISDAGNGWFEVNNADYSAYALAKEDELILDFDYTDYYAPAFKGAGLTAIALEKDGKWGYVSSSGEEIISFKCDGILSSYCGELIDSEEKIHPYLFTEEFLPVSVGSTYGYYNIDGECVVAPGEFEQARPVHNGRAWVRKNGMWGVIQLGEIVEEEESSEESSEAAVMSASYTWTTPATTAVTTSVTTSAPAETTPSSTETEASGNESAADSSDTSVDSDMGNDSSQVTEPPVTETEPPDTSPDVTDTADTEAPGQ